MEDGPKKPDPATVQLAMKRLKIEKAVLVGDTPDDMRAANRAGCSPMIPAHGTGVVPLGILSPRERGDSKVRKSLVVAGASRVLETLDELKEFVKRRK